MESRSKIIIGKEGIHNKTIAIIGVGGLGSITAELLSRMSPKKLILVDFDKVEKINLERQTLYEKKDIGKDKVLCAEGKLKQFCNIESKNEKITNDNISFKNIDLLIDCTDNVDVRFIINKYCKKNKIPWIYSAAIQKIGSIYFVHPDGPCFECFNEKKQGKKCAEVGVLNSTVATIASLTVNMTIKYLTSGEYPKELLRINLDNYSIMKLKVNKRKNCEACNE